MNEELDLNVTSEIQPKAKKGPIILSLIIGMLLGAVVVVAILFVVATQKTGQIDDASADVIEAINEDKLPEGQNLISGKSASKLETLIYILNNYYYKDIDKQAMVDGIYAGLVESLDDPYSAYYTEEEYKDLMQTLTGNYAGIGALLQKDIKSGEVTITKVYANTPAEKVGLVAGDSIVSADGNLAVDEDLDEFVQHIRGEEGTDVKLVIFRDGKEMELTCTRASIATPTVEHQMLEGNVGYIAVSQFTEHTYDDFVEAYKDLENQGMKSVIFDMRNNGGGLVDSVVDMLDYLLPEGTVVYTMDKDGNREDYTSKGSSYKSIPMTVLVNENTASAAEIFTGAIRDFKYGTIIGTNTFGKGIVQSTIPLSDGSAVKLTTQTYYTPSGECIHGKGIAPDIELEYEFQGGPEDKYDVTLDNQIQKALEVLSKQ
ncbi:carboxyl-terminal processing protease [Pseudobutyrivibrio sp. OR37]|uniref:S41 family peptidase n=1 Tax=Pseudobutyrivibrio sp. OR37 TaxID=1798186 RepID=UPI0008E4487A|nr:S41 family peptidase [Pseudobutyrivibrio sp. OR37]SFH84578.1 carboxyl-terminal processing protease [Pseudobutyrivibrio sp. OR37]